MHFQITHCISNNSHHQTANCQLSVPPYKCEENKTQRKLRLVMISAVPRALYSPAYSRVMPEASTHLEMRHCGFEKGR